MSFNPRNKKYKTKPQGKAEVFSEIISKENLEKKKDMSPDTCICQRPHCNVLCNACGYWIKGRIQQFCSIHPQTVFLFDLTHCPRCKSHKFMLTEL